MSGGTRVMMGSYVGTGTAFNVRIVGFRPKKVTLINVTGLTRAEWHNTMADASVFKTFNHASVQHAFVTSNGITPLSNGFTVGTDADLNTAAEIVHYIVEE